MRPYSYDRRHRTAGGIDVQDDVAALLPAYQASLGSLSSKDVAHAAYVFAYSAQDTFDSRVKNFATALAEEYAHRFADWLGYVFMSRANRTWQSKGVVDLQEALGVWVENIPEMLSGSRKTLLSAFLPQTADKFLNLDRVDAIGNKILRVVQQEYAKSGVRQASLEEMPISYNPKTKQYEIPKSQLTFENRNVLRDLGFTWDGRMWSTDTLDSRVVEMLPQAVGLQRGAVRPATAKKDPKSWFFEEWLPPNIDRFTKIFSEYGKTEGVPYEFKFVVQGTDVDCTLHRNIKNLNDAIEDLRSRYRGRSERKGWIDALNLYYKLKSAQGKGSMHAVDMANNLEHTHGAMMEHFPPGVRSWYPKFLDFKYTADVWQLVRAIRNEDLRTLASELLPGPDRARRLRVPDADHRTAKGLALEVSSQPGRARKKKMLAEVKESHPDLYPRILELLEERGLRLTEDAKNPMLASP